MRVTSCASLVGGLCLFAAGRVSAQGSPPCIPPQGNPSPCVVTTPQAFVAALDCIANLCQSCPTCPGGCPTEIVIPAGAVIELPAPGIPNITIGAPHSCVNRPLTIRIHGEVRWGIGIQGGGCPDCKVIRVADTSYVTIDGDNLGLITSDADTDPSLPGVVLPPAITISGDSHHITVRDLKATRLGYIIDGVPLASGTRHNLEFIGLVGEELSEYGIFPGADIVTVQNCRVGSE